MDGDEVCDNGGDGYVDGDGDAIAPLAGDVEGMQGPLGRKGKGALSLQRPADTL